MQSQMPKKELGETSFKDDVNMKTKSSLFSLIKCNLLVLFVASLTASKMKQYLTLTAGSRD